MRRRRFEQINVVPFIDIVLVLLVIVLATATFAIKREVPVDLPRSGSETPLPTKSIGITIDREGNFFVGEEKVDLKKLEKILDGLNPKKDNITLNADRKSRFQEFVTVVEMLKRKRFEKISIITIE
jgi:biopolymer transport protein ExbD